MIGLIYKDIMALKKQLSILIVFIFVYGGLCLVGAFDFSILGALIAVFGLTVPMSSVTLDEAARWDRYAAATPAGRRGVVAGKYLFTLLIIFLGCAVALGLMVILSLVGLTKALPLDLVWTALACAGLTLAIDAVILPFLLKYGAEKARIISMITFVLIFGGAVLFTGLAKDGIPLPQPPAWLLTVSPVLFGLVCIGGFVISYFISQGIYAKKEF